MLNRKMKKKILLVLTSLALIFSFNSVELKKNELLSVNDYTINMSDVGSGWYSGSSDGETSLITTYVHVRDSKFDQVYVAHHNELYYSNSAIKDAIDNVPNIIKEKNSLNPNVIGVIPGAEKTTMGILNACLNSLAYRDYTGQIKFKTPTDDIAKLPKWKEVKYEISSREISASDIFVVREIGGKKVLFFADAVFNDASNATAGFNFLMPRVFADEPREFSDLYYRYLKQEGGFVIPKMGGATQIGLTAEELQSIRDLNTDEAKELIELASKNNIANIKGGENDEYIDIQIDPSYTRLAGDALNNSKFKSIKILKNIDIEDGAMTGIQVPSDGTAVDIVLYSANDKDDSTIGVDLNKALERPIEEARLNAVDVTIKAVVSDNNLQIGDGIQFDKQHDLDLEDKTNQSSNVEESLGVNSSLEDMANDVESKMMTFLLTGPVEKNKGKVKVDSHTSQEVLEMDDDNFIGGKTRYYVVDDEIKYIIQGALINNIERRYNDNIQRINEISQLDSDELAIFSENSKFNEFLNQNERKDLLDGKYLVRVELDNLDRVVKSSTSLFGFVNKDGIPEEANDIKIDLVSEAMDTTVNVSGVINTNDINYEKCYLNFDEESNFLENGAKEFTKNGVTFVLDPVTQTISYSGSVPVDGTSIDIILGNISVGASKPGYIVMDKAINIEFELEFEALDEAKLLEVKSVGDETVVPGKTKVEIVDRDEDYDYYYAFTNEDYRNLKQVSIPADFVKLDNMSTYRVSEAELAKSNLVILGTEDGVVKEYSIIPKSEVHIAQPYMKSSFGSKTYATKLVFSPLLENIKYKFVDGPDSSIVIGEIFTTSGYATADKGKDISISNDNALKHISVVSIDNEGKVLYSWFIPNKQIRVNVDINDLFEVNEGLLSLNDNNNNLLDKVVDAYGLLDLSEVKYDRVSESFTTNNLKSIKLTNGLILNKDNLSVKVGDYTHTITIDGNGVIKTYQASINDATILENVTTEAGSRPYTTKVSVDDNYEYYYKFTNNTNPIAIGSLTSEYKALVNKETEALTLAEISLPNTHMLVVGVDKDMLIRTYKYLPLDNMPVKEAENPMLSTTEGSADYSTSLNVYEDLELLYLLENSENIVEKGTITSGYEAYTPYDSNYIVIDKSLVLTTGISVISVNKETKVVEFYWFIPNDEIKLNVKTDNYFNVVDNELKFSNLENVNYLVKELAKSDMILDLGVLDYSKASLSNLTSLQLEGIKLGNKVLDKNNLTTDIGDIRHTITVDQNGKIISYVSTVIERDANEISDVFTSPTSISSTTKINNLGSKYQYHYKFVDDRETSLTKQEINDTYKVLGLDGITNRITGPEFKKNYLLVVGVDSKNVIQEYVYIPKEKIFFEIGVESLITGQAEGSNDINGFDRDVLDKYLEKNNNALDLSKTDFGNVNAVLPIVVGNNNPDSIKLADGLVLNNDTKDIFYQDKVFSITVDGEDPKKITSITTDDELIFTDIFNVDQATGTLKGLKEQFKTANGIEYINRVVIKNGVLTLDESVRAISLEANSEVNILAFSILEGISVTSMDNTLNNQGIVSIKTPSLVTVPKDFNHLPKLEEFYAAFNELPRITDLYKNFKLYDETPETVLDRRCFLYTKGNEVIKTLQITTSNPNRTTLTVDATEIAKSFSLETDLTDKYYYKLAQDTVTEFIKDDENRKFDSTGYTLFTPGVANNVSYTDGTLDGTIGKVANKLQVVKVKGSYVVAQGVIDIAKVNPIAPEVTTIAAITDELISDSNYDTAYTVQLLKPNGIDINDLYTYTLVKAGNNDATNNVVSLNGVTYTLDPSTNIIKITGKTNAEAIESEQVLELEVLAHAVAGKAEPKVEVINVIVDFNENQVDADVIDVNTVLGHDNFNTSLDNITVGAGNDGGAIKYRFVDSDVTPTTPKLNQIASDANYLYNDTYVTQIELANDNALSTGKYLNVVEVDKYNRILRFGTISTEALEIKDDVTCYVENPANADNGALNNVYRDSDTTDTADNLDNLLARYLRKHQNTLDLTSYSYQTIDLKASEFDGIDVDKILLNKVVDGANQTLEITNTNGFLYNSRYYEATLTDHITSLVETTVLYDDVFNDNTAQNSTFTGLNDLFNTTEGVACLNSLSSKDNTLIETFTIDRDATKISIVKDNKFNELEINNLNAENVEIIDSTYVGNDKTISVVMPKLLSVAAETFSSCPNTMTLTAAMKQLPTNSNLFTDKNYVGVGTVSGTNYVYGTKRTLETAPRVNYSSKLPTADGSTINISVEGNKANKNMALAVLFSSNTKIDNQDVGIDKYYYKFYSAGQKVDEYKTGDALINHIDDPMGNYELINAETGTDFILPYKDKAVALQIVRLNGNYVTASTVKTIRTIDFTVANNYQFDIKGTEGFILPKDVNKLAVTSRDSNTEFLEINGSNGVVFTTNPDTNNIIANSIPTAISGKEETIKVTIRDTAIHNSSSNEICALNVTKDIHVKYAEEDNAPANKQLITSAGSTPRLTKFVNNSNDVTQADNFYYRFVTSQNHSKLNQVVSTSEEQGKVLFKQFTGEFEVTNAEMADSYGLEIVEVDGNTKAIKSYNYISNGELRVNFGLKDFLIVNNGTLDEIDKTTYPNFINHYLRTNANAVKNELNLTENGLVFDNVELDLADAISSYNFKKVVVDNTGYMDNTNLDNHERLVGNHTYFRTSYDASGVLTEITTTATIADFIEVNSNHELVGLRNVFKTNSTENVKAYLDKWFTTHESTLELPDTVTSIKLTSDDNRINNLVFTKLIANGVTTIDDFFKNASVKEVIATKLYNAENPANLDHLSNLSALESFDITAKELPLTSKLRKLYESLGSHRDGSVEGVYTFAKDKPVEDINNEEVQEPGATIINDIAIVNDIPSDNGSSIKIKGIKDLGEVKVAASVASDLGYKGNDLPIKYYYRLEDGLQYIHDDRPNMTVEDKESIKLVSNKFRNGDVFDVNTFPGFTEMTSPNEFVALDYNIPEKLQKPNEDGVTATNYSHLRVIQVAGNTVVGQFTKEIARIEGLADTTIKIPHIIINNRMDEKIFDNVIPQAEGIGMLDIIYSIGDAKPEINPEKPDKNIENSIAMFAANESEKAKNEVVINGLTIELEGRSLKVSGIPNKVTNAVSKYATDEASRTHSIDVRIDTTRKDEYLIPKTFRTTIKVVMEEETESANGTEIANITTIAGPLSKSSALANVDDTQNIWYRFSNTNNAPKVGTYVSESGEEGTLTYNKYNKSVGLNITDSDFSKKFIEIVETDENNRVRSYKTLNVSGIIINYSAKDLVKYGNGAVTGLTGTTADPFVKHYVTKMSGKVLDLSKFGEITSIDLNDLTSYGFTSVKLPGGTSITKSNLTYKKGYTEFEGVFSGDTLDSLQAVTRVVFNHNVFTAPIAKESSATIDGVKGMGSDGTLRDYIGHYGITQVKFVSGPAPTTEGTVYETTTGYPQFTKVGTNLTIYSGFEGVKVEFPSGWHTQVFSGRYSKVYTKENGYKFNNSLKNVDFGVNAVDFSNASCMNDMFLDAKGLQKIENFNYLDTSKVDAVTSIFSGCTNLTFVDISNLNTSKVDSFNFMFSGCEGLTSLDLSNFDSRNVNTMYCMFDGCTNLHKLILGPKFVADPNKFIEPSNPGSSSVAGVVEYMFKGTIYSNPKSSAPSGAELIIKNQTVVDILQNRYSPNIDGSWLGISQVPVTLDVNNFAGSGISLNKFIKDHNIVQVAFNANETPNTVENTVYNNSKIFYKFSEGAKLSIYTKGLANVIALPSNCSGLFMDCSRVWQIDLSGVYTRDVTNMSNMFKGCSNLSTDEYFKIQGLDTANVTNMSGMFNGCSRAEFKNLDISRFSTKKVTNMSNMFDGCSNLTNINYGTFFTTENVENMAGMYAGCSKLTSVPTDKFKTDKVTDMNRMFEDCSTLTTLDVSKFNTSSVTNMANMFKGCSNVGAIDVSKFATLSVTNMANMFSGCGKVSTINVSGFDTSNVTNLSGMFNGCSSVTQLDTAKFSTAKVTDMSNMFNGCAKVTSLDTSSFNTSNVTSMANMFNGCAGLTGILNLSNFMTPKTTDMSNMFNGCANITGINLANFEVSSGDNVQDMFAGTKFSNDSSLDVTLNDKFRSVFRQNGMGMADNAKLDTYYVGTFKLNPNRFNYGLLIYHPLRWYIDLNDISIVKFEKGRAGSGSSPVRDGSGYRYKITETNNKYGSNTLTIFSENVNEPVKFEPNCNFMFYWTVDLREIDFTNASTTGVTSMNSMFRFSNVENIIFGNNFDTSQVTDMTLMFYNSDRIGNLDLSKYDTNKVNYYNDMFSEADGLHHLNMSSFVIPDSVPNANYKEIFGGNYVIIDSRPKRFREISDGEELILPNDVSTRNKLKNNYRDHRFLWITWRNYNIDQNWFDKDYNK